MWKKHKQNKSARKKDLSQHCTADKTFTYQTCDDQISILEKGNNTSDHCLMTYTVEPLHTQSNLLWHEITSKILNFFKPLWTHCSLKRTNFSYRVSHGDNMCNKGMHTTEVQRRGTNICWYRLWLFSSIIFYHKSVLNKVWKNHNC